MILIYLGVRTNQISKLSTTPHKPLNINAKKHHQQILIQYIQKNRKGNFKHITQSSHTLRLTICSYIHTTSEKLTYIFTFSVRTQYKCKLLVHHTMGIYAFFSSHVSFTTTNAHGIHIRIK